MSRVARVHATDSHIKYVGALADNVAGTLILNTRSMFFFMFRGSIYP